MNNLNNQLNDLLEFLDFINKRDKELWNIFLRKHNKPNYK